MRSDARCCTSSPAWKTVNDVSPGGESRVVQVVVILGRRGVSWGVCVYARASTSVRGTYYLSYLEYIIEYDITTLEREGR